MGKNIQRLGDTLANRMKRTAGAAIPTALELGTINSNLSLTTDSLKTSIPKGDYMLAITLTGSFDTGEKESHTHRLPDNFRGLKSGDRVLVCWCGNEPIIVAIVKGS